MAAFRFYRRQAVDLQLRENNITEQFGGECCCKRSIASTADITALLRSVMGERTRAHNLCAAIPRGV